jgi:hypothetical protein
MPSYEASRSIDTELEGVFAYLSEPANLPHYFPRMISAEWVGDETVRTTAMVNDDLDDTTPDEKVTSDAWFRTDASAHCISWGAVDSDDYTGSLTATQSAGSTELLLKITTPAAYPGIQNGLDEALNAIGKKLSQAKSDPGL